MLKLKWVWVLYPICFFFFGVLIGLLTGLSRSPVATTILPLLFTFVGGGIGFYISKLSSEGKNIPNIIIIAICIITFSISCIFGTMSGISLRMGKAHLFLYPYKLPKYFHAVSSSQKLTDKQKTDLILLGFYMRYLGMEEIEINEVIEILKSSPADIDSEVELIRQLFKIPMERKPSQWLYYQDWKTPPLHWE